MSILDSTASAGKSATDPILAKITNPFNTTPKNLGERGKDFPEGFHIVEFVDGVPQEDTAIALVGNLMPMQPFEWPMEQRLTRQYYPGNPEPSVQPLGAKPGDLTIRGRFKDKRYKDKDYYGVAYEFTRALEAMCKRGNLVRFGMYGDAGKWVRYGYLEKTDFKMNKLSWIDYELTFLVISENKPKNDYFVTSDTTSPDSINQSLLNYASQYNEFYSSVPKTVPQSISDVLNGIISGVAKNINLVTNFVSTVLNTVESVEASAHRAIGLIKNVRAQISVYRRQIDRITHSFTNYSSSGNSSGKAKDLYKNLSYVNNARASTITLSQTLARLQAQFEAISKTLPKARYKVIAGDTLQNISVKFYGTADHWDKIYSHNNLATTVLTAGKVLEIPKL